MPKLGRRLALIGLSAAAFLFALPLWASETPHARLAVFDFNDLSGYKNHVLGRRAAARVQVELRDAGRYELVPRADVTRECAGFDLKPPFAIGYQQQVLSRLDAAVGLTGTIQSCKVNSRDLTVTLTLVAELTEAVGGEQIAIVKATGVAQGDRKAPLPLDELIEQALSTAGKQLAHSFTAGPEVTGRVLSADADKQVSLEADGAVAFVPGMRALILHRRDDGGLQLIAMAGIEKTQKNHASGKLISVRGEVKEGDVAVGVFGGGR